MRYLIFFSFGVLAACEYSAEVEYETPGIYQCENVITGGKISFHTDTLKAVIGTNEPRLEVIDIDSGHKISIKKNSGWECTDPTGKVYKAQK